MDVTMYQYETHDLPIRFTGGGGRKILENLKDIIISFKQGSVVQEYHMGELGIDVENDTVVVHFTQESSGKFSGTRPVRVQANFLYNDSERDTSAEGMFNVGNNLHKEVMS